MVIQCVRKESDAPLKAEALNQRSNCGGVGLCALVVQYWIVGPVLPDDQTARVLEASDRSDRAQHVEIAMQALLRQQARDKANGLAVVPAKQRSGIPPAIQRPCDRQWQYADARRVSAHRLYHARIGLAIDYENVGCPKLGKIDFEKVLIEHHAALHCKNGHGIRGASSPPARQPREADYDVAVARFAFCR